MIYKDCHISLSQVCVCIFLTESLLQSRFTISRHQAAVKALAWCPFQTNLLASGIKSCSHMARTRSYVLKVNFSVTSHCNLGKRHLYNFFSSIFWTPCFVPSVSIMGKGLQYSLLQAFRCWHHIHVSQIFLFQAVGYQSCPHYVFCLPMLSLTRHRLQARCKHDL